MHPGQKYWMCWGDNGIVRATIISKDEYIGSVPKRYHNIPNSYIPIRHGYNNCRIGIAEKSKLFKTKTEAENEFCVMDVIK